ncbi:MAG: hypothetical protein AB1673_02135 [Actinomycetota bacterium]
MTTPPRRPPARVAVARVPLAAAVGAVVAVVASVTVASPLTAGSTAPPAGFDEQPLQAAGQAAAEVAFVGALRVTWSEGDRRHSESLLVQGGDGAVLVRGGNQVLASEGARLVEHAGGRWDLLSPPGSAPAGRPALRTKYQLTSYGGEPVVGRSTRVVEVRHGGVLLERLSLDDETGLLLRREQFAGGPSPTRVVEFETLTIGEATVPTVPTRVFDAAPEVVPATKVPSSVSAPATLAGGYRLVGVYKRGGVAQVVYSDGLYDLSVFQQPGRLDRGKGPAGDPVVVGDHRGSHLAWAGGHIVTWEGGGTVHTALSDAPLAQLLPAAASLPLAGSPSPFLRRLRQVCRALVQPFAA